ncbi:uncharacterized protein BDW43DRAFT_316255 [Aspergillus alliaceus]|uniref:uncharacterized protein n=1 Tax=Petromyces alliaceus TaxID=209559 RepID=UPI0012A49CDF|nr:uncharacterized protein BDW43DRAFT_316255 [Aspergillus alliaceus]KAB8228048.1 hypothetical protein BDW43DRAFT_316255 [Aspergillus alliaceus]
MSIHKELGFVQDTPVLRSSQELSSSDNSNTLSGIVCHQEALQPEVLYFLPDNGPEGILVYLHLQSPFLLLADELWTPLIVGTCGNIQCSISYSGIWSSKHQYSVSAGIHHMPNEQGTSPRTPLWVVVHDTATLAPYILYIGEISFQPNISDPCAARNQGYWPCSLSPPLQGRQQLMSYNTFFEPQAGVVDVSNIDQPGHFLEIIEPSQRPYYLINNIPAAKMPVPTVISEAEPYVISEGHKLEPSWEFSGSTDVTLPTTELDNSDASVKSTPQLSDSSLLYMKSAVMDMAFNWTREETAQRRRIVYFIRDQENRQFIDISFSPPFYQLTEVDYICTSCIYWPGREDRFITSSDIIQLLQWLLQTRILQLQRCRIRRNLDRFQPHFISKSDPESFEFTRMVRGFRNPRAVAIRKDMKVFPWRMLQSAITTILNKDDIQVHFLP